MLASGLDPLSLAVVLASLALIPLFLMISTCFLKIAIVLNLVRNAMGVQQVPPNMVIYGIVLSLTIFIMAPVFSETQQIILNMDYSKVDKTNILEMIQEGGQPLKSFMERSVNPNVLALFQDSAQTLWPPEVVDSIGKDNLLILVPSFVVSELQAGFEIGFLIFLPFIVIDLIVSNLLLALGMQMVSPMTVSLPLKILLFVLIGGWEKLLHGLVLSYM